MEAWHLINIGHLRWKRGTCGIQFRNL